MISEAFSEFWSEIADDLGVAINRLGPADAVNADDDTVAVILAAGGSEWDAARWLDTHRVPRGMSALVVGTDPSRRTAMRLMAHGAHDYFVLPEDLEIFRNAVSGVLNGSRLRAKAPPQDGGAAFAGIVGNSRAMKQVLTRAARLLPHRNASALIIGETGTGKELLARAIHNGGPRAEAPFVAVNCSALPEHLMESELFGHERGSFTDAHAAKPGLFEVADGGTLFLDEIGDLPLTVQAKLLRVLEDKEIRRVGGTKSRTVDVRILAAANDRLHERVRQGRFREDLIFRLSTVVLTLPPLRERGDDVVLITDALLQRLAGEHALPLPAPTPNFTRALRAYRWPGNVRELKNALERVLLLSPAGELSADELLLSGEPQTRHDGPIPFPARLQQISTAAARAMVELCGGNRSEAAARLGISPKRLRRLLNGRGEDDASADTDTSETAAESS